MISHYILHTLALIMSVIAIVIFIQSSKGLKGQIKTSYSYTSIGIWVGVTFHSLAEHLESSGFISGGVLNWIMPALVMVGSAFLIMGGYKSSLVKKCIAHGHMS